MKKVTFSRLFLLIFSMLVLCVTHVQAEGNNFHDSAGHLDFLNKTDYMELKDVFLSRCADMFDGEKKLSDEKLERVRDLRLKVEKAIILREAELKTVKMDLDAAIRRDSLYMNSVYSFIEKKYELKKQIAIIFVDAIKSLEDIAQGK